MTQPTTKESMLTQSSLKLAVALALASFPAITAKAQDAGALVDKLVKKGILTNKEAEEVRADMNRDYSQTSAGKIKLSPTISELKLYGDFRYRFQYDDKQPQVASPDNVSQRVRHRWRLRLAADINLTDHFYGGFSIETGQPSDTGNQVVQDGFDDYNVFLGKAYLGWRNDWLDITVGKFRNPFYTTELVWDSDINPQGLIEQIAFHKMPIFGGSGGTTGDYSKDGKTVIPSHSDPRWELTLVAGQLIYDDNNEFNFDSDANTDAYVFVEQLIAKWKFNKDTSITIAPAFMSFTAADLTNFTNENFFSDAGFIGSTTSTRTTTSTVLTTVDTVSADGRTTTRVVTPTTVTSTATTITNPNGTTVTTTNASTVRPGAPATTVLAVGGTPNRVTTTANTVATAGTATPPTPVGRNNLPAVSGETRALHILTAPGDISFKIGGLKSKVYWDFAYNFTGRERFNDIYQLGRGFGTLSGSESYRSRDSMAWLVGFQLGETKKKGDWVAYLNYRETGIASLDPNLNESDFALSELNTRGFKLGIGYAFSDAVVLEVKGMMAWNIDKNLFGGRATNAPAIADSNAVNVVQVDLNVKF